jgi:SpoVK/Ycf46/Vps4 family AAA+-type ATPase
MQDLMDVLEQDPPQESDPKELQQMMCYAYLKYIKIFRDLEDCYDQHVHPQKRRDIKVTLESVMGRMLEIKQILLQMLGPCPNFDDIIIDLKLVPDILEIPVPKYYRDDEEAAKRLDGCNQLLLSVAERLAEESKASDALVAAEGEDAEPRAAVGMPVSAILSVPDIIRVLQANERGRQGRQRFQFMKAHRHRQELEAKIASKGAREMDADIAAITIQRMLKGFVTAKMSRRMREEELVFIGMEHEAHFKRDLSVFDAATKNRILRKRRQEQHELDYKQALIDVRQGLFDEEGPQMATQMRETIMKWARDVFEQTGVLPDLPDPEDGGSLTILDPPPPPVDGEEAAGDLKGKGKGKGDKKEEKKKGKKGDKAEADDGSVPLSEFIPSMRSSLTTYVNVWEQKDEDANFGQHHDTELIKNELRPSVKEHVRVNVVDSEIVNVLENMKKDLEKGGKGKKGKAKKGKKKGKKDKKKGKKGKDLTEGRTSESLTVELAEKGILKHETPVSIVDFIGAHRNVQFVESVAGEGPAQDMSGAQLRQHIIESFILPLGCQSAHQRINAINSVCLYGPASTGKTMLTQAIAYEAGAQFFDISPTNTAGKYSGGKGTTLMLHMVFKLAKILQPSVIYIDDAEYCFCSDKKKEKEFMTNRNCSEKPSRIKKDIAKEMKALGKDDLVLVVGNSRTPWVCEKADYKAFTGFFKSFLYTPLPDYATLQKLWSELVRKKGASLRRFFDLQTVSHICFVSGFAAGTIHDTISKLLHPRRLKLVSHLYEFHIMFCVNIESKQILFTFSQTDRPKAIKN